jgi:hypothetical protein
VEKEEPKLFASPSFCTHFNGRCACGPNKVFVLYISRRLLGLCIEVLDIVRKFLAASLAPDTDGQLLEGKPDSASRSIGQYLLGLMKERMRRSGEVEKWCVDPANLTLVPFIGCWAGDCIADESNGNCRFCIFATTDSVPIPTYRKHSHLRWPSR